MELVVDEKFHAVLPREPLDQTLRMLRHAVGERTGHADVEHTVGLAGENVNAGVQEGSARVVGTVIVLQQSICGNWRGSRPTPG